MTAPTFCWVTLWDRGELGRTYNGASGGQSYPAGSRSNCRLPFLSSGSETRDTRSGTLPCRGNYENTRRARPFFDSGNASCRCGRGNCLRTWEGNGVSNFIVPRVFPGEMRQLLVQTFNGDAPVTIDREVRGCKSGPLCSLQSSGNVCLSETRFCGHFSSKSWLQNLYRKKSERSFVVVIFFGGSAPTPTGSRHYPHFERGLIYRKITYLFLPTGTMLSLGVI